ncbi:hypothetical protein BDV41DRAFT_540991 [Aspergillus transmontanensis]|uniref:Uncharacterized protein n=1 Tax=Aspergillus transmontanensis TaxID=1034304 RepID=A0A5N6VV65_9EURO|nr:hypothetical protein BDV41DRAFT_540991 [Aspergillus transmontanensis]
MDVFQTETTGVQECVQEFYYGFLCIFSPWEMEELKCFQEYVFHHYEELPGASYSEDDRDPILLKNKPLYYTYGDGNSPYALLICIRLLYRWIRISRISCPEERLTQQIAMTRGQRGYLSGPMLYAFQAYPDIEYQLDYGDEGTAAGSSCRMRTGIAQTWHGRGA